MDSDTLHSVDAEQNKHGDVETVRSAHAVLRGQAKKGVVQRILPFLGPAFVASVAYIDPGNFATNIAAGAQFGYLLLWVILASNLMAMLIQTLSAKLGIATGHNLAEMCRDHFPSLIVWGMWALSEIVAMATDLAEFLGAAIGFQLLLRIPLLWGGLLTALATSLIRACNALDSVLLRRSSQCCVGIIALSYLVETILEHPSWGTITYHAVSSTILWR